LTTATTFGRLCELELESKRRAFDLPLSDQLRLFLRVQPALLTDPAWLDELQAVLAESRVRHGVVAEIGEGAVFVSPGRLLAAVEACRGLWWQVALDGLGARTETLSALRWIQPDMAKFDTLVMGRKGQGQVHHVAATLTAYRGQHQIEVVADGIQTDRELQVSKVLDADLMQGSLFGAPQSPARLEQMATAIELNPVETSSGRIATKRELLGITRHIESEALTPDTVLLAALQRAEFLTARTWQVVAISPTRSVAIVAHELDPPGVDTASEDGHEPSIQLPHPDLGP